MNMIKSQPPPMSLEEEEATRILADARFHQTLTIPPSHCRDRSTPLSVAFADIGDPNGAALVSVGGLFGSRYTLALADGLARARGVRLLVPDKPGIGGTDGVGVEGKMGVWLEIITALTSHLHLPHIAILGHSSGTIYALNSALHQRHLLHPQHPYIALAAPWVHPSDSGAFQASVAAALPDWAVRRWYDATKAITQSGASAMLGPSTARPGVEMADTETDPLTKAIDEKILQYTLEENVEGVSQEALFCLRGGPGAKGDDTGGGNIWGGWDDYDGFLRLLRESEGARDKGSARLAVDVYFAEEDKTSGNRGSEWFDECWKTNAADFIDYTSRTMPGTTHETVMRPEKGVLDAIFQALGGRNT
ncbi:hypothetical protein B0T24DRAFT_699359 [Lasiosphaeria ovina]|uniref:AB hydrolase-1 domain-containing protein n=1 Tax=Lasiosphaeria ovina TaxID=92902 RepID=A0AAE0NAF5_9PEZI|nr:hypothetical protein B0T24DRAFT_699359 [Lasiosphaeria ovina]